MKRALIIHGWESNSKEHWFQEEKKLLENLGYEALVPDMPNTNFPIEEEWVKVVQDFNPNENAVLIGHSLGAPTILRYLEKASKKVGKAFLVAGFADTLNMDYPNSEYVNAFVADDFNWSTIKEKTNEVFVINQRNDDLVPLNEGKIIAEKVGAKLILVDGTDHFDKMDLNLINRYL